ncbi:hypothetical protein FACS189493_4320 [Spirochaetia bacterium]|nr:hypothetical protein FACS189493_4320 [Spirochaetia bacterium]
MQNDFICGIVTERLYKCNVLCSLRRALYDTNQCRIGKNICIKQGIIGGFYEDCKLEPKFLAELGKQRKKAGMEEKCFELFEYIGLRFSSIAGDKSNLSI